MYIQALQGYEDAFRPKHTSMLKTVNNLGILQEPRQASRGGVDVPAGATTPVVTHDGIYCDGPLCEDRLDNSF